MARGVRRSRSEEEQESYFVSMADMMVGLLFVFIILLLYFALQFRQTTHDLSSAEQSRAAILKRLDEQLRDHGLAVSIDTGSGVLRLPEDVLFDVGHAELTPRGRQAVAVLGQAMQQILPCYTYPRPATGCPATAQHVDAIFIEGHTDSDPMAGQGLIRDNLDLSVIRATNTFRALVAEAPGLGEMRNQLPGQGAPQPILSVSGYGADRPVDPSGTPDAKRRNRRIDLRFLMATPQTREPRR
ncbi:OmpA family protein [uncultured Sphingomonas sp.]|uniref:OmpA/MotB family protein n=1 Tax=uncultured Sphingomonas sp. TaxID=158754 RepID=UPI002629430A|nr:OmpA family protein [uncultured Sphingomonas sp.]